MKRAVMATFILALTLSFNFEVSAQDLPDFEAELRALENNQLETEELQMRNADAVTDVITDEVATGQSGVLKEINTDTDETIMMTKSQKERTRRIRSRPL